MKKSFILVTLFVALLGTIVIVYATAYPMVSYAEADISTFKVVDTISFEESERIKKEKQIERKNTFLTGTYSFIKSRDDLWLNLSDEELNKLLNIIYDYSIAYNVDAKLPISYIMQESKFNKSVSSGIAHGLYQFKPETIKDVLGSEYYWGCWNDFDLATKAWFEYYKFIKDDYRRIQDFQEKEMWTALSYVAGPTKASSRYKRGESAFLYEKSFTDGHYNYATKVLTNYYNLGIYIGGF